MRLGKAHTSALAIAIAQVGAFAQGASPCPRFPVGSSITAPQDLLSQNGVLQVTFTYQTTVDQIINPTNNVPATASSSAMAKMAATRRSSQYSSRRIQRIAIRPAGAFRDKPDTPHPSETAAPASE